MLTFKRKSGVNYYHNSTFRIKPESRRSANSTLRKMSANARRRVADYRSRAIAYWGGKMLSVLSRICTKRKREIYRLGRASHKRSQKR